MARKSEPKTSKKPTIDLPEADIDDTKPAHFSKELAITLHEKINAVIMDAITSFGLELVPDAGTFTNDRLRFRVEIRPAISARDEWTTACLAHGFQPQHLGATFTSRTKPMRIMGYDPVKKPGKPIRCMHVGTGNTWYYPVHTVKKLIGAKAAVTDATEITSKMMCPKCKKTVKMKIHVLKRTAGVLKFSKTCPRCQHKTTDVAD
jgi:hypothetical protein